MLTHKRCFLVWKIRKHSSTTALQHTITHSTPSWWHDLGSEPAPPRCHKVQTSRYCRFTNHLIFCLCHLGITSSTHTAEQTNPITTPLLLVHVWVSFVLLKVRSSLPPSAWLHHSQDSTTTPSLCKPKSHLFKKYLTSLAPTCITPFSATSSYKYASV